MLEIEGNELPAVTIKDAPDMEHRGYYFDATRGRVISVKGAKKMIDRLANYKINVLQFYVEHTFDFVEFRDENRSQDDCLTAEDILEIDKYCYENFIDFQPSLSTFGHLFELLSREEYKHLCELENYTPCANFWLERMQHHTIDASNDESFDLICSLIDQYLPLFRSKYFNICCDETFDLGKGRNQGKDATELYTSFVSKIIKHVNDAGKTVMMWADIVLHHPELLDRIPKDTIMLNWDYNPNPDEGRIKAVADVGLTQMVCPSNYAWNALIERAEAGEQNIVNMARHGHKYKTFGMLNTTWGDHGHACHPECSMYGAILGACVSWDDKTTVNEEFEYSISRSLYKSNTNIISLIRELEVAQRITSIPECLDWTYNKLPACFPSDVESAKKSIENAKRISKTLSEIEGDKDIIFFLKNAAEGIALLSSVVVDVKTTGQVSKEWYPRMEEWFSEYKTAWLGSAKPSELNEIFKVLCRV